MALDKALGDVTFPDAFVFDVWEPLVTPNEDYDVDVRYWRNELLFLCVCFLNKPKQSAFRGKKLPSK